MILFLTVAINAIANAVVQRGESVKLSVNNKRIKIFEFIKRYELDPIEIEDDGNPLVFTIDVIKEIGDKEFYCKVFRKEFFRLLPSFQQWESNDKKIIKCDEELLVEDSSDWWSNIKGSSPEEVLQKVLNSIKQVFEEGL